MATIIQRKTVDSTVEKRVLGAMITSTPFLNETINFIDPIYFESTHAKKLCKWISEYYSQFGKAPYKSTQTLFDQRKSELKQDEADLIEELLIQINDWYEAIGELNVELFIDDAFDWMKKRELQILAGNVEYYVNNGKLKEAEQEVLNFHKIRKIASNTFNPTDPIEVERAFEQRNTFFSFTGDLGKYVGDLQRGWSIGVSGGFKRGKTWMLQEFAVAAMLQKLKVHFFSLEMGKEETKHRLYMRLLGLGAAEEGIYAFPCFDCRRNQDNSCNRPECPTNIKLLNDDGGKPKWNSSMIYKPCSFCKDNDPDSYLFETWFEGFQKPGYEERIVRKGMQRIHDYYGKYLSITTYPRFSANTGDLNRDLDAEIVKSGIDPDIIITDYADIFKPEEEGLRGTEKEDMTWIAHSKLAAERRALVITGTQITKKGLKKRQVGTEDQALWIGKLAHVDALFSLNQTAEEKDRGIMRLGTVVYRHKEFSEEDSCTILQNYRFGQSNLDSYWRT